MEKMNIIKNHSKVFQRRIILVLLVCALFVGIFAITLSPQKAHAAQERFEDLSVVGVLEDILTGLDGNQSTLTAMGLDEVYSRPAQNLIDGARTKVRAARDARPPTTTTDESVKSAWAAMANLALAEVSKVPFALESAKQNGLAARQADLTTSRALCADPQAASCTQRVKDRIAFLEAQLAQRSVRAAGGTPAAGKSCGLFGADKTFDFITCIWNPFIAAFGALLISIAALFLALADMLFNWSVDKTVLLFKDAIFAGIEPGINAGWSALRDIANIVIIGMFTFIAISTILSIQEYGAKKLLARVLVIAVIINFSLLFTKIIIDVSNFTAGQFYASMAGVNLSQAQADAQTRTDAGGNVTVVTATAASNSSMDCSGLKDSFRCVGIGGAFIGFLKVTSFGNTYEALKGIANGGAWYIALAHGLLAFVLLGGAGCVLFYGAYLLISRAVLFIFLMVTAAGAFATHLRPKVNESNYGWEGWWSSLLHNAALAPILMVLLWITLQVSSKLRDTNGILGNLASANASNIDVGGLFSYFIILGLLWGSFLLASKWASKVGGLSFTGMLMSSATLGTAAVASRFIAAPIARKYIGGNAARRSIGIEDDLKDERIKAAEIRRLHGDKSPEYRAALDKVTGLMKKKDRADLLAKGSFNLPNTKLAQQSMKALGIPSFLSGAQTKPTSYADSAKKRAEEAIKDAEKLVLRKEDVGDKTRGDIRNRLWSDERITRNFRRLQRAARDLSSAARTAVANRDQQVPGLTQALARAQAQKTAHEQNLTTVSGQQNAQATMVSGLKGDKARADAEAQGAQTRMAEILTTSQAKVAGLDQIISNNAVGSTAHTNATNEKAAEIASQTILVQAETNKINAAQAASAAAATALPAEEATLNTLNANVQAVSTDVANATSNVKQVDDQIKELEKAVTDTKADSKAADEALAKEWDTVDSDIEKGVEREVEAMVSSSRGLAVDAAARYVHRRLANLPNVFLGQTEDGDTMTKITRKMAGSSTGIKYKEYTEMWKALGSQFGAPGAAPAAGPQQSSGPAAGGHPAP